MWSERLADTPLSEIKAADLEKVMKERLATVKPATVNREFAFLRHVFNIAIRDEKAASNPVAKLMRPKGPSGRVRYLNDDEEERLLAVLPSDIERDRVRFLTNTGLRKSEFLGLRWRDIDLKAGILTIPRSKNGETRHVLLNSTVKAILNRVPRPLDGSTLVFRNTADGADRRWTDRLFPKAVHAARIQDFRFHDLRHTFASRLAMSGADLLTIKDLGGWKNLMMVQRYAHLSPSHRQQAIERLVSRDARGVESVKTGNAVAP